MIHLLNKENGKYYAVIIKNGSLLSLATMDEAQCKCNSTDPERQILHILIHVHLRKVHLTEE